MDINQDIVTFITNFDERISHLDTVRVVGETLRFITDELELFRSSIALLEPDQSGFRLRGVTFDIQDLGEGRFVPFALTSLSQVVQSRKPRYRPDIREYEPKYQVDAHLIAAGMRSDYVLPLIVEGECIGTLNSGSPKVDGISEQERQLLVILAPRLAQALRNANLHEALQENEKRLWMLLDSAPSGIVVIDADTHEIVQANAAAVKMFGAPPDQIIASVCHTYICPVEEGKCPITDLGQTMDNSERVLLSAGGKRIPVLKTVTPVMLDGRKHLLESFIDISKQKQTQKALHRSLEETAHGQRLLLALGHAAQAVQRARTPGEVYQTICDEIVKLGYHTTIFTLTDDRTHLVTSHVTFDSALLRTAEKLMNLSARDYRFPLKSGGFYQRIIAEGKVIFIDPGIEPITEALPALARPLAGRLAKVLGLGQTIYAPLKTGDDVHGLLTVLGHNLTQADVPAVSAFASQAVIAIENARLYQEAQQEIAERKRAEEGQRQALAEALQATQALRESEERYRELVERSLQGIAVRQDNRYILTNQSFADMTGYSIDELSAFTPAEVYALLHPDEREMIIQRYIDLQTGKVAPDSYEHRFIRKDGETRWTQVTISEIEIRGKAAFMGMYLDITEHKRAEEALQRSEEHFRALTENASDIIIILNADMSIRYGSPSVERLLEYEPEEFVGKMPSEFVHPGDMPIIMDAFSRVIQQPGIVLQIEFRLRHKDGSWRVFEALGNSLLDDMAVEGIIINSRDVTERKQAEETLQNSESFLDSIIEQSPYAMWVSDDEGTLIRLNQACRDLLNLQDKDVVGKYNVLKDNIIKEQGLLPLVEQVFETGNTVKFNIEYDSSRLEHIEFEKTAHVMLDVTISAVQDTNGNISNAIIQHKDITEQVRSEKEREQLLTQIGEQARRVQQIMDTVPEGVLLLHAGGRIILANPMAEDALLVLADAKVGDTLTHLGDRPLVELLTLPPRGLWHEVKLDAPNGQRERIFEVIARPMELVPSLPNGNGPGAENWVLVINDVTREREIQQRAQQQERLAAVGQLAAGIAHDFNNIMATIVLYAQMTERIEGLPERVLDRMATINRQAQHATRLIQQILDFSRRAVLERRPLDLLLLVQEQIKLLKRTLPESIKIDLAYGWDDYATPFLVNADPTRMQQMMTNLAVNARDAMPEGGSLSIELKRIRIEKYEATPVPEMEPGEWVWMTVADTGTGISPDALQHIYEPFFTTKAPLGSGLGLAQVHGIVAQHEGHIDVQTRLGQGTAFSIYLPALPVHPLESSTGELFEELPALVEGQEEIILVVEDNATMRKALAESLKLLNYEVLEAANGQEALSVLEQHAENIAMMLSDVVMPRMDGITLFHTSREKYPQIPIVLLTGHPMKDELESLRAQGLSGWLSKPPDLDQLAEMLARALREGQVLSQRTL